MSYVQSALVSGEQVLHEGRFSPVHKWEAFFLCFVGIGIFKVISMWATEIVITNRRLIYKRSWIARKAEEISLRLIEDVNLSQGILGRLGGYGEIQVHGMGSSIILPPIGPPMIFKRGLQEAQVKMEVEAYDDVRMQPDASWRQGLPKIMPQ